MAIHLNKIALAALGMVSGMGGGGAGGEDLASGGSDFDGLVEAGERLIDRALTDVAKARKEFGENVISGIRSFLSEVGVPMRDEIDELRRAVETRVEENPAAGE